MLSRRASSPASSSTGSVESTSLAGRLRNRLRRSGQAGGSGSTVAATAAEVVETAGDEQQVDLDDCAELSELLLSEDGTVDAECSEKQPAASTVGQEGSSDLQAQLMALAIENESLRARAERAESDLVLRLRRQLEQERALRLRAESAAADAAAGGGDNGSSGKTAGPLSRAVASLRRRRRARAEARRAANADATSAAATPSPPPDGVDLESLDSADNSSGEEDSDARLQQRRRLPGIVQRARSWLTGQVLDLLDDLQRQPERGAASPSVEEPALSARRLKANAARFGRNVRPVARCLAGIQGVLGWRSPSYTALVAVTYYLCLRYGLLLSAILLLCIARLGLNYLKYRRHWSIEFNFLADYETAEEGESTERERTVGTQVNLVVQVARKVQNLAGQLSDNMEKFKNLITWRSPKHTQSLLNSLLAAFAVSLAVPAPTFLYYIGLYMAFKLLVVNALFNRYPRLKRRHDSVARMWRSLPTDQQLGVATLADVEKYVLPDTPIARDPPDSSTASTATAASAPASHDAAAAAPATSQSSSASAVATAAASTSSAEATTDEHFARAFGLPDGEQPLARWRGGKRCALVCKETAEHSLPRPGELRQGRLFLTRSFLCFERSKDRGKMRRRNLVIPLAMVRWVKKSKPFSWLPGSGMSIEVQIYGIEKPITFGAILGRDEAFDSLQETGRRADLPWALDPSEQQQLAEPPQPDPQLARSVALAMKSDSDLEEEETGETDSVVDSET